MSLPYTRAEVKDRARTEWRGLCNVTLPSFTSDFSTLNAAGIAHDVRLAAQYGFWGTLVASESGTTLEEYLRFMEIAAEAAPERFRLVAHLSFSTVEEELIAAKAAEALGYEAALLSYPPGFRPGSASDIVDHTKYVAERTDLALIMFAVMTWGFSPLHPSGFPPEAIEEIARIDTAAALKYEGGGSASMTAFADIHRRVGDRLIVENPMEQNLPALVEKFGVPWFGTSAYESFGDRVPRVYELASAGKYDEAMDVFWSYQAARAAKGAFHASFAGAGLIHRVGWKYLGWLQGFNGGLLRMPQMRLNPGQMKSLRAGLAASGFELPTGDEDFYLGRNPA
ncbi:4-hydroxy-tetrahydrodipicolinate synthase [Streptosporangium subroseum]|uniref:4-hydroxy-tetrahydrodipicolinate synthase n=1 Tax=Streptosporangium subroseum TaxID=106412 RepID=A0A239CY83_9ACTN|nr:dihydrodipicolinate synthase family protein [Streptosporangium subroseum]SNS25175.1 4-hydroxy-tetrahydrodipicolinate synthase [Streptosporangium subroseum]